MNGVSFFESKGGNLGLLLGMSLRNFLKFLLFKDYSAVLHINTTLFDEISFLKRRKRGSNLSE